MRYVATLLLAGLAACEAEAPPPPPASAVPVADAPEAPSPPPPRYAGRWAASAEACETGWWRFWNDEVLTAGETRCDILPPDGASGDERLRTVCQADGKVAREEWVMTYPADRRMTVARDDDPPVALVRC